MTEGMLATATIVIDAGKAAVWEALVTPSAVKQYMFGTTVASDWQPGSAITWSGEWNGKPYQDKGTILTAEPETRLAYSHFSPLAGKEDIPANYHTVSVALTTEDDKTRVTLTQDGSATETERDHSQKNWQMMLSALKDYVEGSH